MTPLRAALRDTQVRTRDLVLPIANGSMALGSAVGLAAVAAWLIARAAEMPSPADIALAAVIVRFFGISRGLFRYLERLASHRTALTGVVALRESLYTRLAGSRVDRVLGLSRGDIVARMGADLDAVGDAVVRALIPVGVAITVSVLAVGIVGSQLPVAGAALAVCLVLAGVVPAVLTWRSARIAADLGIRAHAHVSEATLSALESAPEHRVWGTTGEVLDSLHHANREAEHAQEAAARPAALAAGTQSLFSGLALVAAVGFAVTAMQSGDLSGPSGAIVALTPLAAFEAVGLVPAAVQQWWRSHGAAVRLDALTDDETKPDSQTTPHSHGEPRAASDPQHRPGGDPDTASAGALTLDHVSAAWPEMTPTPPVDVTVAGGGCLGITGRTGAGKTTLLLTIAGALMPAAGGVLWRGEAITPDHTGHAVAMTAEDAHVFGTTVLENLRVARGDATRTEAADALETVGLADWAHEGEQGLDMMLGSGGHTVSGGERRRLLLARVLLHPAPVHLIDEPSEHLDASGIAAFRALIATMRSQGRTVVIVTHDVTLLDLTDQVVNLDR